MQSNIALNINGRNFNSHITQEDVLKIKNGISSKYEELRYKITDFFCQTKTEEAKSHLHVMYAENSSFEGKYEAFLNLKYLVSEGHKERFIKIDSEEGITCKIDFSNNTFDKDLILEFSGGSKLEILKKNLRILKENCRENFELLYKRNSDIIELFKKSGNGFSNEYRINIAHDIGSYIQNNIRKIDQNYI